VDAAARQIGPNGLCGIVDVVRLALTPDLHRFCQAADIADIEPRILGSPRSNGRPGHALTGSKLLETPVVWGYKSIMLGSYKYFLD